MRREEKVTIWGEKKKKPGRYCSYKIHVCMCVFAPPYLKGHELVVGFGSPGIDFHRVLQSNHQELNPLVFY